MEKDERDLYPNNVRFRHSILKYGQSKVLEKKGEPPLQITKERSGMQYQAPLDIHTISSRPLPVLPS